MVQENLTKEQRKSHKTQRRLEKEQRAFLKQHGESKTLDVTNILCVRFGKKYSIEYVERLRNMISRNITVPYKLYCLTDDPTPIKDIELIIQPSSGYVRGWWHKVHMFDSKLPIKGRILYMDLDVVICGNIDKLTQIYNNDFMGIRDFNRKFHPGWNYLNSSVMSWIHGTQRHIYELFKQNVSAAQRMHGDQDWTWKCAKDRIKFWPEQWIQSYKWEIRDRSELHVFNGVRQFRTVNDEIRPNTECCIAVFHGDPNPAIVKDKFVVDNWK